MSPLAAPHFKTKNARMSTYQKILKLLTPKERRRCYFLLVMIVVMGLLDTIGVASIMPFMSVLENPEAVETNKWLRMTFDALGFEDTKRFLFFLGFVFFAVLITSISFKALTQWALLRFTNMRNHSLSCRLLEGYLGLPYTWFLNRHSADLGKGILSEVTQVISGVLVPAMQFLAQVSVALFLAILLFIVDPILSLIAAVVLGGACCLIYTAVRKYLSRIGKDRVQANAERFQVAQETFGGIKEVKVFGTGTFLFQTFRRSQFPICPPSGQQCGCDTVAQIHEGNSDHRRGPSPVHQGRHGVPGHFTT